MASSAEDEIDTQSSSSPKLQVKEESKRSNQVEKSTEESSQASKPDENGSETHQNQVSKIYSTDTNGLLYDSGPNKQDPSANVGGVNLKPLETQLALEVHTEAERQNGRHNSIHSHQGDGSNKKQNSKKPLQSDKESAGSLDELLKSKDYKEAYKNYVETNESRGSSESVEKEIFIRKSDLSGTTSSEERSSLFGASSKDSFKSLQNKEVVSDLERMPDNRLNEDTEVTSHEKPQEEKQPQRSHESQHLSKESSSSQQGRGLQTEDSSISAEKLLRFEDSDVHCESNDVMTESMEIRPSEILTIETDLEEPRSDSEESLEDDSFFRSKCFLLAYGIMGFFSNYQRTTIRTANLDFIHNVQTMVPRIHRERKYIGQLLVVEYMAELFEDSLTDQLGISTMRKLYISLCISLFDYLMLLHADTNSQLLWGIGAIIVSMSMSFNSMIDHLQLFDVKAAKAYNAGLQFAHLIAPGAYSLLSSVLEPKAQWWPFIVIPFLDVIIFYLLLRPRELRKHEELAPNYLKTENSYRNFLIKKFCGSYSILGPFALTSCVQLYTSQGIFPFFGYRSKRDNSNANKFRWLNTIFRLGHFGGAALAFCLWTSHTWPLPLLSFMNLVTLMAGVLTDIKVEGLVVLVIWDGFLSGFGEMCALKAMRFFGQTDSRSAALELRLVRKLKKIAGLICAIILTLTDELLFVSLLK